MPFAARAAATGLDRITAALLFAALALAFVHHVDHILRVDHSGWPFRDRVTGFTYSLAAYPVILFALFGSRPLFWLRWALLAGATGFTLFAHSVIESPQMQFHMWAHDQSLDQGAHIGNMPGIRAPALGALSVAIGMALNVTAVVATIAMLARGFKLRAGSAR